MTVKDSQKLKYTGLWMLVLVLFMGELFFYTWCRVNNVRYGYEVAVKTDEKNQLLAFQNNLKIELERLKSPERIAKIAEEYLDLRPPGPEQMVTIQ